MRNGNRRQAGLGESMETGAVRHCDRESGQAGVVTGWRGGEAAPPRGDLNLGKRLLASLETLAEVDFNSYRPPDLATRPVRRLAFLGAPGASITRAGRARLTRNCCATILCSGYMTGFGRQPGAAVVCWKHKGNNLFFGVNI